MCSIAAHVKSSNIIAIKATLLIMIIMGLSTCAVAQSLPPDLLNGVRGEIWQIERGQELEWQRRLKEKEPQVHLFPSKVNQTDFILPEDASCYQVSKVLIDFQAEFAGANQDFVSHQTYSRLNFILSEAEQYIPLCIGQRRLAWLLKQMQQRLLDEGYTTTIVGIGEQDLSFGVVRFTVVPGVIGEIQADEEWRTRVNHAFPFMSGDLLNLRDLEQGLEQLKRAGNPEVEMQITPGDRVGQSNILIKYVPGSSIYASMGGNNFGTAGVREQNVIDIRLFNPLRRNDVLAINRTDSTWGRRPGSTSQMIDYSVPWGYWMVGANFSFGDFAQTVTGPYQSFVYSGKHQGYEARLERLLFRGGLNRVDWSAKVSNRQSNSYLDGDEILVQRRNNSSVEASLSLRGEWDDLQWDGKLSRRLGMSWFGAMNDQGAVENSPRHLYRINLLEGNLSVPMEIFGQRVRWAGTVRGQLSETPLYASEWLSLGNRWTVRGYNGSSSLGAENGAYWRNDLDLPFLNSTGVTSYVGFDIGRVYGPSSLKQFGTRIAGCVLGFKGVIERNISFDFSVARPILWPENFKNTEAVWSLSITLRI